MDGCMTLHLTLLLLHLSLLLLLLPLSRTCIGIVAAAAAATAPPKAAAPHHHRCRSFDLPATGDWNAPRPQWAAEHGQREKIAEEIYTQRAAKDQALTILSRVATDV
jgi:hypothetical protein